MGSEWEAVLGVKLRCACQSQCCYVKQKMWEMNTQVELSVLALYVHDIIDAAHYEYAFF